MKENVTGIDFIRRKVATDIAEGRYGGKVVTRFPPEPNGYLHIGHAKAICIDFGIASEFGGRCHLRFDDTDPAKEDTEYVEAIKEDIKWLGFDWREHLYYASDYFEKMYEYAVQLIKMDKAYVCGLSSEEFKMYRGSPPNPGKESPWRNRPISERLELFQRMKNGEFKEGQFVLRAKIDMSSSNIHMRDPVLYRIKHQKHHRTGNKWCIYPTYDFAHCLSDSIEGITHSFCTLEFAVHRPLYDWILDQLGLHHPQQIEFSRLNLTHTVMSKRKLKTLIDLKFVNGWDDPRLPTLKGLRRRGYTPSSIKEFCRKLSITRYEGRVDYEVLENEIRQELNKTAPRFMAVCNPLKVVIENYEGEEFLEAINNPEDPSMGIRYIPFSKFIYIEKEDFMDSPPPQFYRLTLGGEVRLRYAYIIKCIDVIKDNTGNVIELRCIYYPETRGGKTLPDKKVKGTIHWVSCLHAKKLTLILLDRLFLDPAPDELPDDKWIETFNYNSWQQVEAYAEPSVFNLLPETRLQLERNGYYYIDPVINQNSVNVLTRIVPLKDSWKKVVNRLSNM